MKPVGNDGWRVMSGMAVVFALPILLAAGFYFSGWRPASSAAHGRLVVPPIAAARVPLGEEGGRQVRLGHFRDHWILLYFGPADCPADCLRRLYAMRQVQVAQGSGQARVRRVFVARGALSAVEKDRLESAFPGLSVVSAASGGARPLPAAWAGEGRVFLIDPLGNLIMYYEADASAGGMRRDLSRLLAYSWVG